MNRMSIDSIFTVKIRDLNNQITDWPKEINLMAGL